MTDLKNNMSPNKFVTSGKTKLITGSIVNPELGNLRLIFVPCSENGKPDSALHTVLNKKWRTVVAEMKGWYAQHFDFKLGSTHTTAVQSDTWVIHALCYNKDGRLDEKALAACVKKVGDMAKYERGSVHVSTLTITEIPALADLLSSLLIDNGVSVYFYQEPETK